jgi:hypothetical protein
LCDKSGSGSYALSTTWLLAESLGAMLVYSKTLDFVVSCAILHLAMETEFEEQGFDQGEDLPKHHQC